jgi:hypothetical protein
MLRVEMLLYLHAPVNLCLREEGGGIFEAGIDRELLCDSEISTNPLPGEGIEGILLGGRIWDVRIN